MAVDKLKGITRLILMFNAEGIRIMDDKNTFKASEQLERELIWAALQQYKDDRWLGDNIDANAAIDEMIERVSQTFSWVRS